MVKLSQQINEIWDIKNETELQNLLISMKLCIEELSRKAQSLQEEIRADAPGATTLEEGEMVRATVGGLYYIYTKYNGAILRFQLT